MHHWVGNGLCVEPVASPDLFEALEVLAQLRVHTRRHDLAGLAVPEVATSVEEPVGHLHPLHIPTSDTAVFPTPEIPIADKGHSNWTKTSQARSQVRRHCTSACMQACKSPSQSEASVREHRTDSAADTASHTQDVPHPAVDHPMPLCINLNDIAANLAASCYNGYS